LEVCDDDGDCATASTTVDISNVAPTADANGPYSVDEGDSVSLSGSGTDPGPDSLTYAWDLDDDGTFETPGQTLTFSAAGRDGPDTQTVVLEVCDDDGDCATASTTVDVLNVAPTADANGPYSVDEGGSVPLNGSATDPGPDSLTYAWDLDDDGTFETPGQNPIFSAAGRDGPDSQTVVLEVCDDDGDCATAGTMVEINNVAPTASLGNDGPVGEGSPATVSFGDVFDPSSVDTAAGFHYAFACDDGSLDGATYVGTGTSPSTACTFDDDGGYTVRARIIDKDDGYSEYQTVVTVTNVAPLVGEITAPLDPLQVNTAITASAMVTDVGVLDTHTAIWDWGDGITSTATVSTTNGAGTITATHTYTTPGVYTIRLTVTDDEGDSGESIFRYVVFYDPDGGFVTGSGWIQSPEGAYPEEPTLTGKAHFGFNSKYKKGANVPTGNTRFRFKVADLDFRSDTYDWLVVAGAKAKYKGVGTINGEGEYKFMLTGIDADINPNDAFEVDRFRIKIWTEDGQGNETIVYDNGLGADQDDDSATTEISAGSIVIHQE
jgi:PKD repeat protein